MARARSAAQNVVSVATPSTTWVVLATCIVTAFICCAGFLLFRGQACGIGVIKEKRESRRNHTFPQIEHVFITTNQTQEQAVKDTFADKVREERLQVTQNTALKLNEVKYFPFRWELQGLPDNPIDLNTLRLCEATNGGPIDGQFECKEDPTCEKCIPNKYIVAWEDTYKRAMIPQAVAKRQAIFLKLKQLSGIQPLDVQQYSMSPQTTPLIQLIATDLKFMRLTANWLCRNEHIGANIRNSTLFIALDTEASSVLKNLDLHVMTAEDFGHTETWRTPGGDQSVKGLAYFVMAEALALNISVLFNDADVVWVRDARRYIAEQNYQHHTDVITQLAPTWSAHGQANTGIVLARANLKTQVFFRTLTKLYPLMMKDYNDQRIFNALLRHWKFRQLSWQNLPKTLFGILNHNMLPKEVEVYETLHVVGANGIKESLMKKVFLWHFNDNCSIFAYWTGPKNMTE